MSNKKVDEVEKKFGEELRKVRKARGLTLIQLGKILSMSHSYISFVENGDRAAEGVYKAALLSWMKNDDSNAAHTNMIPEYGSVPAGWPSCTIDQVAEEPLDYIPVKGSTNELGALLVEGHSMSPEIRDGMYVLYVKDYNLRPGDIVVATDEYNRALVKQYVIKDDEPWLVSINPEYPSFQVNEHYRIIGRVFEKYDKSKVGRGR